MTDDENESKVQKLGRLRDQCNEKIGTLLDYNAQATLVLRNQAKSFEALAIFYKDQADRCCEVAGDIALLARINAELTGDVIAAEFGIDYDPEANDDTDENSEV